MKNDFSSRDINLDLLKVLSIIGVIIVHTCIYSDANGSFEWGSALFWGTAARSNVPVFLMCSGAMLLAPEKELTLKKLYLKNFLRLAVSMLFWAMAYKVYWLLKAGALSGGALFQASKEVLAGNQEFHLYYLQIMLLVYAFLPVTRLLVAHATKRQLEYALLLWFIFGIIYPTVEPFWPFTTLSGFHRQYIINMTYASIGYGVLGWYLRTYRQPGKRGVLLWLIGFAIVYSGTWILSQRSGTLSEHFFGGMTIGCCLLSVGRLVGISSLRIRYSPAAARVVVFLSRATFCTYLVHPFFLYFLRNSGLTPDLFPRLLSIPLLALANYVLCTAVYLILSHIPVIKKWLV